ncbi:MAG: MBL fold metallo-hydrolase [Proteobacteria bacterium]|nr:MAG: MBL fold metallo-hydrolase [Pseudomonadota bacterium]
MIADLNRARSHVTRAAMLAILILISACKASSLPFHKAEIKQAVTANDLASDSQDPGPIRLQKIVSSDWQIGLAGLLNIEDPKAKAALIEDRSEPIQLYFYVIDHPQFGRFFIDSGVSNLFAVPEDGSMSLANRALAAIASTAGFTIHSTTGNWIKSNPPLPQAVFLTHMHFDHVLGLSDIPDSVPIFTGQGETDHRAVGNFGLQKIINALIGWDRPIFEIPFVKTADLDIVDWFGDKTFFVISAPGHTRGSLAFLVRSTEGWQLIVGDSSHTRWGWENSVRPGSFTDFGPDNQKTLEQLIALSKELPNVKIHPGHQSATSKGVLEEIPAK